MTRTSDHLTQDEFLHFVSGQASAPGARADAHIEGCEQCSRLVEDFLLTSAAGPTLPESEWSHEREEALRARLTAAMGDTAAPPVAAERAATEAAAPAPLRTARPPSYWFQAL